MHFERPEKERRFGDAGSQENPNPRPQFVRMDGFADVVVSTKFKAKSWIDVFGARGSKAAGSIVTNAFSDSAADPEGLEVRVLRTRGMSR